MPQEDYRDLELEANAQGSHHVHIHKWVDVKRIMEIHEKEYLTELEQWQTAVWLNYTPVNTLK